MKKKGGNEMPKQDYEYVDFMSYDGQINEMVNVCRVYLTKGKLIYEGEQAECVKSLVENSDKLRPFRKIGGYSLLAMFPNVFCGSYFHATAMKEPYEEVKKRTEGPPDTWQRVQTFFRDEIGLELPKEWHPDPKREPLGAAAGPLLVVSAAVTEGVLLPVLQDNLEAAPLGTWLVGYWGYGVNSYACYLVRKDERREVFLRLFFGGAYGDAHEDAKYVANFIKRAVEFERWAVTNLNRWCIFNDMGRCGGWIEKGPVRNELPSVSADSFRFPNE